MAEETPVEKQAAIAPDVLEKTNTVMVPSGMADADWNRIQKQLKDPNRTHGMAFQEGKQRNAMAIQKGLTKPGAVSYDTLRRISMSVYVARICINNLKAKVTKTPWVVQPIDQKKRKGAGEKDKRIKLITDFLKHPNRNDETFRTLLDKMVEDLLVLDSVSIEKTRYPDGSLAELHFVDSATIRPVYDQFGNQDVLLPLKTVQGEEMLPVSYLQVLNNSQYGGPESGDIVAAWPKHDFIHFHMNPQGSMENFGYGLSPLEAVLSVVSNLLNADNYNSSYFEEGAFPPVILNIVGQIAQRDLDAFKEYFYQEISGNFHRPALLASQAKSEVINLKDFSNQDMQFMEYILWMAKMMCAAYQMSPEDIGITDTTGSKNVSETQKDLSQQKGYSSILDLLSEIINQEIVWKDFGFDDLEFSFVADDMVAPDVLSQIQDRALKNGTKTINEIRLENGDTPFDEWADEPMVLTGEGYKPINPEDAVAHAEDMQNIEAQDNEVGGEEPYQDQEKKGQHSAEEKDVKKSQKSVQLQNGYKVWMDDRGTAQPFIYIDIKSGWGTVIKPPVAVNLTSTYELEEQTTAELAGMGLNVRPVRKMTYNEVRNMLATNPEVQWEFDKYLVMTPEYDSEKWRAKYGGSRKFDYYLVTDYIDGLPLTNPMLLADMKRDPMSYAQAARDLANLWKVERDMLLGDRRPDQYIITKDKRAFGFDYQFRGDQERWERYQGAIAEALEGVPELKQIFLDNIGASGFSLKSILSRWVRKNKINR